MFLKIIRSFSGKISLILSIAFFFSCSIVLYADSSSGDFYYYNDEKICLDVSVDLVAVRFKDSITTNEKNQIVANELLFNEITSEFIVYGVSLINTKSILSQDDVKDITEKTGNLHNVKYSFPVYHYGDLQLVPTDEIIVRFKEEVPTEEINAFNDTNGIEIIRSSPYRKNRFVLRIKDPKKNNPLKIANEYHKNAKVKYAVPNFLVIGGYCETYPDDTYFGEQWPLHNTGQVPPGGTSDADMNAPEGWEISTGKPEITIAIIDSGTDISHEDLVNNIWVNEIELNGTSGVDDDNNGYIDDIYGWDFEAGDDDPSSTNPHGTACAGLAAAETNNGLGVAGVDWRAKLMPLKIGTNAPITSAAAEAIDYAFYNGADVLSNSWTVPPNGDLTDAIENAKSNGRNGKGCVILAASGNGGAIVTYPATLDETIAVGATDENDVRWGYSNYGDELDVVAPSSDGASTILWTTDISGSGGYNSGNLSQGDAAGNYTKWFGGTSAATPQVAGLAGLVLSLNPSLTSDDVQSIIETTADDLGVSGWDQYYGWGRINIYNALLMARSLSLSMEDDVEDGVCLDPCDLVEYTITYGNPISDPCESGYLGDANDVYIIDYLSDGFTFVSADPCENGFYNAEDRYFRWDIGTLQAGDGGDPCDPCFVTITLQVNSLAEPNGVITNEVIINDADNKFFNRSTKSAMVCCWCNGGIMYVNRSATGENTGVNWENAYTDLQHAMTMARACFRDEIWVAKGIYKPTYDPDNSDATFELVPYIKLLGGFGGWESDSDQRKAQKYKTYLTGDIDGDSNSDIDNVVSGFNAGTDTLIDGFIIGKSKNAALYIEDAPPLIERNTIRENDEYGIYFKGTAETVVKNCWIHNNGDHGIYYYSNTSGGLVRNCTIAANEGQGVYNNGGDDPNVVNCILWQNNNEGYQFTYCDVTYSDYKNPGDPNVYEPSSPDYNIHCDPCFIFEEFDEPNTYTCYLKTESACIDRGDPCGDYNGEYDINADERVIFEHADMGADEFSRRFCGASPADFDDDGVVGLADFARISEAWLTDPLDQNWDPCCDLDYDDEIAMGDLTKFSDDWLLMLCSLLEQKYMENGPGTGMPPCPLYGGTWQIQYSSPYTSSSQSVVPTKSEPTIEELIEQFKNAIIQLELIWQQDSELIINDVGEKEWFEFIDSLYKELEKLIEQLN